MKIRYLTERICALSKFVDWYTCIDLSLFVIKLRPANTYTLNNVDTLQSLDTITHSRSLAHPESDAHVTLTHSFSGM